MTMEKVILMSNQAIPFYMNKISTSIDHRGLEEDFDVPRKRNKKEVENEGFVIKTSEVNDRKVSDKVLKISVLGERHTGTTWIWKQLDKCFSGKIQVNRHLTRYKHWFQYNDGQNHEPTLVLNLFRDPYYWTMGMRKIPHHAPNHIYLPWQKFVSKPWTMERIGKDLNVTNYEERICQERFYFNEVISCYKYPHPDGYFDDKPKPLFSGHQPLYELRNDGSGEPFDSILELRTAKIKNFMGVKEYPFVHDAWNLKYEDLILEGTAELLRKVEEVTGVKANCEASPPQKNRWKRSLDPMFVKYLNDHLDWDVERSIGYEQIRLKRVK